MIIKTEEQFKNLMDRLFSQESCVVTRVYQNQYRHRNDNKYLLRAYTFHEWTEEGKIIPGDTFILNISHDDAPPYFRDLDEHPILPTESDLIKSIAHVYDVTFPELQSYFTNYIRDTHSLFGNVDNVNNIIPITVWSNVLTEYNKDLLTVKENWDLAHLGDEPQHAMSMLFRSIRILRNIEDQGICVDNKLFKKYFDKDPENPLSKYFSLEDNLDLTSGGKSIIYSEYNPYTITGRPSNRFGGVNFAALNKSDGSREAFVSRYDTGLLALVDFEAYHLRLIANELGVDEFPPDESIHTTLAKKYFSVDEVTSEMYDESKKKTFAIMYGNDTETYGIKLFEKIKEFKEQFKDQEKIKLPDGRTVTVDDPSPSKLFNYYMQSLEFVRTVPKLQEVLTYIEPYSVKLALYTYDSILLDFGCSFEEVLDHLEKIRTLLEEDGKFPAGSQISSNYHLCSHSPPPTGWPLWKQIPYQKM